MGSHFANIENISVSESLPYIEPGRYVLQVDRCLIGSSTRGKGDFFVAEFTVVNSDQRRFPAGTRVLMVQMFSKGEVALSNIKSFAASVLKKDHRAITAAVMDRFVDNDGAAVQGQRVVCNAQLTKTKAGNDFTKLMWSAYTNENFSPAPLAAPANPGAQGAGYSASPPPSASTESGSVDLDGMFDFN